MASSGGFRLNIEIPNLDRMIEELDGFQDVFYENLEDGVKEYGSLLEEGGQGLAPYDGGDLETSIQFKDFRHIGNIFQGAVGSDLKYALRRHEDPVREGSHDKYDNGVKYEEYYTDGRGQETIDKPNWRGMEPGRKYLERAADATLNDFDDIMADVYDRTLRGLGR